MIPIDIFLIESKGMSNIEKYADSIQLDRNTLDTIMMSNK